MRLLPWLVDGFGGTHPALAVLLGVPPAGGWRPPLVGYAAGSVLGMGWLAAGMGAYVWWLQTRVGPGGVRGYNFWGLPAAVPWDAAGAIRRLDLGVTALRVRADAARPGFAGRLAEFGGPDHPLAVAARGHLAADDD